MRKLLTAGIFGTILGIVGAGTANASIVSSGFLDEKLTEYALSTSLDLKANQSDFTELNTQISNSVDNLKRLWEPPLGQFADGFNPNKVNNDIEGAFDLVEGFIRFSMLSLTGGWTDSTSGTTYLGVKGINATIGTLPSGNFPEFPESENFFSSLRQPLTYPTSLAELITALYGNSETDSRGLLSGIITSFPADTDGDGRPDTPIGLLPNYSLAKNANDLASANAAKIGTLPSGSLPTIPEHVVLFPELNQPLTYPTSLAELITALYGNSETDSRGLLAGILGGFPFDTDGDGQKESNPGILPNFTLANDAKNLANANATKIGTVPDGKNLAGMLSETDAKIGTLPTGYDSIGAALTAIKGIAEDAKAAALAAIPDPKQEGSSGKFVLTVDIVGDNATYRWEKIDREGETTTTE
ncbi:MAG: hypothetical protein IJN91_03330 [Alphaproteobacteria bacterium]|nr:hypothetical protein [Alphaproteobacteria bacterium]